VRRPLVKGERGGILLLGKQRENRLSPFCLPPVVLRRIIKLPHANRAAGQVRNDLQLAAQRANQPLQRADLHILLRFEPGKRRLLDAKRRELY